MCFCWCVQLKCSSTSRYRMYWRYCAFVGPKNKLHKIHGTYIYIINDSKSSRTPSGSVKTDGHDESNSSFYQVANAHNKRNFQPGTKGDVKYPFRN